MRTVRRGLDIRGSPILSDARYMHPIVDTCAQSIVGETERSAFQRAASLQDVSDQDPTIFCPL